MANVTVRIGSTIPHPQSVLGLAQLPALIRSKKDFEVLRRHQIQIWRKHWREKERVYGKRN